MNTSDSDQSSWESESSLRRANSSSRVLTSTGPTTDAGFFFTLTVSFVLGVLVDNSFSLIPPFPELEGLSFRTGLCVVLVGVWLVDAVILGSVSLSSITPVVLDTEGPPMWRWSRRYAFTILIMLFILYWVTPIARSASEKKREVYNLKKNTITMPVKSSVPMWDLVKLVLGRYKGVVDTKFKYPHLHMTWQHGKIYPLFP